MDSFRTGYISRDEFVTMITELCPTMYEQDAAKIAKKLESNDDGRVGYVKWIKQILRKARKSQKVLPNYDKQQILKPISRDKLAKKVAHKLGIANLSILKESFMKCDLEATGKVSHVQFRAAVRATGVMLQDRDLRKLVEGYSINKTKSINYRDFLKDAFSGG